MAKNLGNGEKGSHEMLFAIASSEAICNGIGAQRIRKPNIRPLDRGLDYWPSWSKRKISKRKRTKRSNLKKAWKQPEKRLPGKSLKFNLLNIATENNKNGSMEVDLTKETEVASNIKKFLGRGLLNGWVVTCYKHNQEKRDFSDAGTKGEIRGNKIKCFCESCRGIEYCALTEFERHAKCLKKRPAENFYLPNRKTVRDVMNKCKLFSFNRWEEIVKEMLGPNLDECTGGETTLLSSCLSSQKSARLKIRISSSMSASGVSSSTLSPKQVKCDQCEKMYPLDNSEEHTIIDLKKMPEDKWLCDQVCTHIQSALHSLINCGEMCLPQHSVDNIQNPSNIEAKWRLLRGYISDGVTKDLLKEAVMIFHERFNKIKCAKGPDLIPLMVYGRSSKDLDFHGMYTAIVTVKNTVVCAAIFRVFGNKVAELPIVAVKTKFGKKGYFRRLLSEIEGLLRSLKVKKLLLPAANEVKPMWIKKFKFNEVAKHKVSKYENNYPITRFGGTKMLYKNIVQQI